MMYRHQYTCGSQMPFSPGKIVCVGRNYAAHAAELGNPVPEEPLLFIKPGHGSGAHGRADSPSRRRGSCHFEGELALLIGEQLTGANSPQVPAAIAGVGLALDLTLREVQSQLKKDGHPWEKAKGFDGACPLSPFVKLDRLSEWRDLTYSLWLNGELRQCGETAQMLTPVPELVAYISRYFTLLPGDVVLTGTPAGVGELRHGDRIAMQLEDNWLRIETCVG